MKRTEVLSCTRMALVVRRWHTWPVTTQQTIGEHVAQVLRTYRETFGHIEPEVVGYVLYHDSGELQLGDLPFPVKSLNPVLKEECDRVEQEALHNMGVTLPRLTEIQKLRIKYCDVMDMLEFGVFELRLGNQYAEPIIDDTRATLHGLMARMVRSDFDAASRYWNKMRQSGVLDSSE